MKNNLPHLGASPWHVALRVSQELTHQSLLELEEKCFQSDARWVAAGDPAWWENARLALGQVMSPQLPPACAASQLIGRDTAAPWEVPLLPRAEHRVLPCGQIQSGCLAQMTHEGKEKAFWSVLA